MDIVPIMGIKLLKHYGNSSSCRMLYNRAFARLCFRHDSKIKQATGDAFVFMILAWNDAIHNYS